MNRRASRFRSRWSVLPAVALAGTVLVGGCGGGEGGGDADTTEARGEQLAEDAGCVACHGVGGVGGVGPKWTGLFGSERRLESGEVVVADGPYLERSIAEPSSQLVEGYTIEMPENQLSASEIDDVVAYIESLS
jgi:cytochrome c oxidase subunit 2